MALGDAADGRVAAHLRDQVEIHGDDGRLEAHARGRHRSFAAGMARADYGYVELFGERHCSSILRISSKLRRFHYRLDLLLIYSINPSGLEFEPGREDGKSVKGSGAVTEDYLLYYDVEKYLFEVVHRRFHKNRKLDAFDLFSIIIWKANRAKSKLASRLVKKSGTLEMAAEGLTHDLLNAETPEERLFLTLEEWGFELPMATSILSVLWPEVFTVYDYRVCEELRDAGKGEHFKLGNLVSRKVWPRYCAYREAVESAVEGPMSLRDKDRLLWGRSTARQLREDIESAFAKAE
jgi:hypothetical protein